ncbi:MULTISPECIES: LysR substrate-binding domain-containing protein [unclassified Pseudomonas]|uniref:LysR substrate-binding domain-containing protein n=1 Tax=unclassified Pseudomonas TaxID=196821 RepID=UPI00057C4E7C|nr:MULTISPECIES: LysR substrate-binding domain-containing protein [unclassified Pseudomonas]KIC79554.1 LysR family transcriptional regulator [Pseudomonas sp. C5pp]
MDWSRRLRLRHLHLLVSLAETGSLSDTARLAHTTQPGLSKWLKELEEDVGATLFERHARGLRPTAHGQLLLGHARRILSEMARAQHNLEALQEGDSRSVALGTSPASAPSLVPDAITYFLRQHPRSRVQLQESTMNALLERLEQGELDVVVGRLDSYQPRATLRSELLYHEPMQVVARPGHPLSGRRELGWEDLLAYDWILWPEGTPIRSRLDMALTQAGLKPLPCRVESSSLMGNLWLLQNSDMISVASGRVAEHFTARGLVVSLDFELETQGSIGMCWRDEPLMDGSVLDLLDCLRQAANTPIRHLQPTPPIA